MASGSRRNWGRALGKRAQRVKRTVAAQFLDFRLSIEKRGRAVLAGFGYLTLHAPPALPSRMEGYDDLFALRGSAYDSAMQVFPDAREAEFRQALARIDFTPGMIVADVPAGGGYLRRYLPADCEWWGHEPCATFTRHDAAPDDPENGRLLPLPWPDASVDAAVSVAGVHHLDDKRPLFEEIRRVVKPGGVFALSDVATGTAVAHFLDEYVGTYNSTGHQGVYLDGHTLGELAETGWQVESCDQVPYQWMFPDRAGMAEFCHRLFDLRSATLEQTRAQIEQRLGVTSCGGEIGMNWSLMTIRARRD